MEDVDTACVFWSELVEALSVVFNPKSITQVLDLVHLSRNKKPFPFMNRFATLNEQLKDKG